MQTGGCQNDAVSAPDGLSTASPPQISPNKPTVPHLFQKNKENTWCLTR